ncbi:MAG: hydrogenase expression/formation protein HypE [Erysipelotrichaceae bacterium]|nr:hydrogenase expression/formation protein HypE [Erysipelotrichaceae bacterium]
MNNSILMIHGSGGQATDDLIQTIFTRSFSNEMEDSAVVAGHQKLAVSTDSFVVTPLVFKNGDIGRLAVCGTVNDLLMRGAIPKYLTCGFILEEGLSIDLLKKIVSSMAQAAKEAGVSIVAGDTKVIEGNGGMYINTAGIGFVDPKVDISAKKAQDGDIILVSGNLGDHHAAILGDRLSIHSEIESDVAPLNTMVERLLESDVELHSMRDVTRGGLATVLKELAENSQKTFHIYEKDIPVSRAVQDFCGLLGLDPLYMGNEGKCVCIVAKKDAQKALSILRHSPYGQNASIIGSVETDRPGQLLLHTDIGGIRRLSVLQTEGLPRIC